ncbi:hypothetical protein [Agrobacterium sp. CG674]
MSATRHDALLKDETIALAGGELDELHRLEVLHTAAHALGGVKQHVSVFWCLHYFFWECLQRALSKSVLSKRLMVVGRPVRITPLSC